VKPAGILLAGGLASRMGGGDKSLKMLAGRPILAHVIERVTPQVTVLALNANGDPARFTEWRLPVIPDTIADYPGPLAGIHAGMAWVLENHRGVEAIVSIPTDTPFLPADLVERLQAARQVAGADVAVASSGGQPHPVVALWPVRLAPDLYRLVTEDGMRRVTDFARRYNVAYADFQIAGVDPFLNINRAADLEQAELRIEAARVQS
jgi:molybdopterin-guanine dinucleotide biosynthesis protein A